MKAYFASPINEQFNDSYGQRGLQPSTGGVAPIRNVNVEYKNDPTVRRGGRTVAGGNIQASTVVERDIPKKETSQSQYSGRQSADDSVMREPRNIQEREPGRGLAYSKKLKQRRKYIPTRAQKIVATAHTVKDTAKAARATYAIWSWAFYVWFWFQIPVAIFSLVMMGLHQVFYSIWMTETITRSDENLLLAAGRTALDLLLTPFRWAFQAFLRLFDIDPNIVGGIFMMTNMIVMVIGWLTLFTAAFIYLGSGNKPILGKSGGAKTMTFLLAMVAYAIPFLNIFPWFIIWTLMVLKNPK